MPFSAMGAALACGVALALAIVCLLELAARGATASTAESTQPWAPADDARVHYHRPTPEFPTIPFYKPLPASTPRLRVTAEALAALDLEQPFELTMPAVPDQGCCGSCWIYSGVGVLEGLVCNSDAMTSHPICVPLSKQQVISCLGSGKNPSNDNMPNCAGGLPEQVFDFLADSKLGLMAEADWPATSNGGCPAPRCCPEKGVCSSEKCPSGACTPGRRSAANGHVAVQRVHGNVYATTTDVDYIKYVVKQLRMPVAVAIRVPDHDPTLGRYLCNFDGILTRRNCPSCMPGKDADGQRKFPNHAVLITGWGTTPTPHWIIRNSWGSSPSALQGWDGPRHNGYFRIAIEAGSPSDSGVCQVLSHVVFPYSATYDGMQLVAQPQTPGAGHWYEFPAAAGKVPEEAALE